MEIGFFPELSVIDLLEGQTSPQLYSDILLGVSGRFMVTRNENSPAPIFCFPFICPRIHKKGEQVRNFGNIVFLRGKMSCVSIFVDSPTFPRRTSSTSGFRHSPAVFGTFYDQVASQFTCTYLKYALEFTKKCGKMRHFRNNFLKEKK